MNIQNMLSNVSPETLRQGLSKISNMLTPEQMAQMQSLLQGNNKNAIGSQLGNLNPQDLISVLKQNPKLMQSLSKNPQVMKTLMEILKNQT
ncbi:MAG: hypothetical protein J6C17_02885 [Clostridia bacterium]|nr:hypothetical protein [Clostridia bacterium]